LGIKVFKCLPNLLLIKRGHFNGIGISLHADWWRGRDAQAILRCRVGLSTFYPRRYSSRSKRSKYIFLQRSLYLFVLTKWLFNPKKAKLSLLSRRCRTKPSKHKYLGGRIQRDHAPNTRPSTTEARRPQTQESNTLQNGVNITYSIDTAEEPRSRAVALDAGTHAARAMVAVVEHYEDT